MTDNTIKKYFEASTSTAKGGYDASESDNSDSEETHDTGNQELDKKRAKTFEKGKSRKQYFSIKWLEDPLFSGWLLKTTDGRAKYICCNINLSTKRSDLLKYAKTVKHKLNSD
ncbi:uncharacterized protein [Diabrotica undecimpunctata]|uniref:uncharacterized protein n=1 Tax=Diabrotica undecimpunctata TaxID=50387 RepID=UPI003B638758